MRAISPSTSSRSNLRTKFSYSPSPISLYLLDLLINLFVETLGKLLGVLLSVLPNFFIVGFGSRPLGVNPENCPNLNPRSSMV